MWRPSDWDFSRLPGFRGPGVARSGMYASPSAGPMPPVAGVGDALRVPDAADDGATFIATSSRARPVTAAPGGAGDPSALDLQPTHGWIVF